MKISKEDFNELVALLESTTPFKDGIIETQFEIADFLGVDIDDSDTDTAILDAVWGDTPDFPCEAVAKQLLERLKIQVSGYSTGQGH